MSIDLGFDIIVSDEKPENPLADAIYIAIRDAEIHGTDIIVQENGKLVRLSPVEMRARLAKS